jgi:hypothetical protein
VQSFDLPLGASAPAIVDGTLDDKRFALHIKGDATLERLQQFARAVGVGAPKIALAGPASINLVIGAPWNAFTTPQVDGTIQLKNARAEVPGLALPVEISTARVELDQDRFTLRNASATVGKVSLSGLASFPRSCDGESPCESGFDLTTDDLNPERWNELLNPRLKKKPWYRLLGVAESGHNVISNLHASGHIAARRLTLGPVAGSGFDTAFTIANGVLVLTETRAKLLGGDIACGWKIDFTGSEPTYESTGTATHIQAEKLATLLKASLGNGALGLQYRLQMAGWDAAALARSSTAETDFTWTGGTLRISPDGRPLRVFTGQGKAALDKNGWTISASKWSTPTGIYQLRGTASRDSALALEFTEQGGAVSKVTGTLLKPQFGSLAPPPTQARRR